MIRAEWDFIEESCDKLVRLGMIRESNPTSYVSVTTIVVRRRDENENYRHLRQCGDYGSLHLQTEQERYPLINI